MSEYIVEMRNITKRFPGIVANDNVSLQIKKGEIFALLGENGAGKSTLMSMLFGTYKPDEGDIFINGKKMPVQDSSFNLAKEMGIGMVHQHFKLVSEYTIAENIILGVEPIKKLMGFIPYVDIKESEKNIKKLSKKYGLEVDPTLLIKDVNISVQQRVEILKMLYREAEILIFDEPTAVLTPQEIEFLLQIILELRESGKTIILITHKLEEIKKIADRCAVLFMGKLVDVLNVKETSTKELASLMVGRDVVFTQNKSEHNFGDVVLEVNNLTVKNKQKFEVVKDVSLSIREGEIFAIAGVSGNGQVEIADAINGLQKASSGNMLLKGEDITNYSIRKRTQMGMSYIPEDRQGVGIVMDFSLRYNLSMKKYYQTPFSKKGILNQEVFKNYANKLIDDYDIRCSQGESTLTRSMSGGNQQKAIVGREIDLHSPLMIFVQPTRGMDIGAIENIHREILQERDNGRAILLVSLELDEIMKLADTIGVIYNGKLLKTAPANEFTKKEVGRYMMGVDNV